MRPDWPEYFFRLAEAAAERSTCPRAHVGAIIVLADKYPVATGYNGSKPGFPHCDDVGCLLATDATGNEGCVRTIHAEANAIAIAKGLGINVRGGTLYVTKKPCSSCAGKIERAGLVAVFSENDLTTDE